MSREAKVRHRKAAAGAPGPAATELAKGSTPPDAQSAQDKQVPTEAEKKKQNFIVRAIWTIVMLVGFIIIIAMGHIWTVLLILACQILTFKECISVTSQSSKEKNLPLTKSLNWYLLFTTIYYLDGESFIHTFNHLILFSKYPVLMVLASHHKFISFCLYIFGFIFFVATLQKGFYKFQFAQLCITHMVLLLVVFQAHLIINNIFNGMIWFLLPALLVVTNDIFAYLCGITFGKTQLIAISPKKTVEGFVGAWIFTLISAALLAKILSQYNYMICPVSEFTLSSPANITCNINPIFTANESHLTFLPAFVSSKIGIEKIPIRPIYLHSFFLATFASFFAPFGGFFASGLKRTFKVKDFGDTIPGHGGITDRIDCQFLMGSFTYLYYESFLNNNSTTTVGTIFELVVNNLDSGEILHLLSKIAGYLFDNNILSDEQFSLIMKALHT